MTIERKPCVVIDFTAAAKLRLNGKDAELKGGGKIDSDKGIVEGRYIHTVRDDEFDPRIFKTVLVTGYPSVCESIEGAYNPFKFGDYSYRRSVDFGARGKLQYDTICRVDERGTLQSEFDVTGEIDVPKLANAAPVIETWSPVSDDTIEAAFCIVWPSADGREHIVGRAHTLYQIPKGIPNISGVVNRHIRFARAESSAEHLMIEQHSRLGNIFQS